MNIRFYLQRPKEKISAIMLSVSWEGQRLQLSAGMSCKPSLWNSNSGKVRFSAENSLEINLYLENIKNFISKVYVEKKALNKQVRKEDLKQAIKAFIQPEKSEQKKEAKSFLELFQLFIDNRIDSKKFRMTTIGKFKTTKQHLEDFSKAIGYKLTFEKMNEDFCDKFFIYLTGYKGLANNSAKVIIRNTKTFLLDALDKGYTNERDFIKGFSKSLKNFTIPEDAQSISLTQEELDILESLELTNETLQKIRDLFLLECYTGLRYSDLFNLKPENIRLEEKLIVITTIKTEKPLIIPIHNKLGSIILKYPDLNFPKYSNPKYNLYLKNLCKEAEFFTPVQIITYRGKKRVETTYQKYELVTTHTARRTFITLLLKKGLLPEHIMKISGHKNRAAFQKYVRLTQNEAIDAVKNAWD